MNTNLVTITIRPAGRNIYDLAEHCDREIYLDSRYNYAVVAPAYYRIKPVRCVAEANAIRQMVSLRNYDGVRVIDRNGRLGTLQMWANYDGHEILWDEEGDPCIEVSVDDESSLVRRGVIMPMGLAV